MEEASTPVPAATPAAPTPPPAPGKGGRLSPSDLAAHLDSLEAKPLEAPAPEKPAKEDGEDEGESEGEGGDADPDAPPEEQPSDPDLHRRLDTIQKQQKRANEQTELKRLDLLRELDSQKEAFRAEWEPQIKEAQKLKELHARAKDDPGVLADEYGWTPDEQAQHAQLLWTDAHAKKGDAKYKAAADNMRRDRETRSKTTAAEKRMAELEKKLDAQDAERRVDAVAGKAQAAVTDKHPVLKSYAPEYLAQQLRWATQTIRQQTGKDPDPAAVADVLEQNEKKLLLDRLGPEKFSQLGYSKPATPKPQTKNANETKVATPMKQDAQRKPLRRGQRLSPDEMLAALDAESRPGAG